MLLFERDFLKPTKKLRTLAIMESLAGDATLSQNRLSELSGMSGAMVNQYLKDLRSASLIEYQPINGKSFQYSLTTGGHKTRRAYLGTYCCEIVQAYSGLKGMIRQKLAPLEADGRTGLALFGASETCEVVLAALADTPFRVLAITDNDPAKHGQTFHGHVIQSPVVLSAVDFQAVIITSFGRQDEIHRQLKSELTGKNMEIIRL